LDEADSGSGKGSGCVTHGDAIIYYVQEYIDGGASGDIAYLLADQLAYALAYEKAWNELYDGQEIVTAEDEREFRDNLMVRVNEIKNVYGYAIENRIIDTSINYENYEATVLQ
jgi:hypothetical protein